MMRDLQFNSLSCGYVNNTMSSLIILLFFHLPILPVHSLTEKSAFQLNLWRCFLTSLSFTLFKGYIKVLVLALNSARGAQVSMPIMLVGVKSLCPWHHLSWFLLMCVSAAWTLFCVSNIDLCALSLDVWKQSAVVIIQWATCTILYIAVSHSDYNLHLQHASSIYGSLMGFMEYTDLKHYFLFKIYSLFLFTPKKRLNNC